MANLRLALVAAVLCAASCSVLAHRNARIVQGNAADIEQAPWLVQIVYFSEKNPDRILDLQTCGGVIVSPTKVLTAAHCYMELEGTKWASEPAKYTAMVAGATKKQNGDTADGKLFRFKTVAPHPKYKFGGFLNLKKWNQKYDVAVITLAEPLEFNDRIQPIDIIKTRVEAGKRAIVGGWGVIRDGATGEAHDFHPTLKLAVMETRSPEVCKKHMSWTNLSLEAEKSLVCAHAINGNPCQGDSGSGLWLSPETSDGRPLLVGLVQSAFNCKFAASYPLFLNLGDPDIQSYLVENGVSQN